MSQTNIRHRYPNETSIAFPCNNSTAQTGLDDGKNLSPHDALDENSSQTWHRLAENTETLPGPEYDCTASTWHCLTTLISVLCAYQNGGK